MTEKTEQDMPLKAMVIPVTPLQQNCVILWCTRTGKGAVVDPGGDVSQIIKGIEQAGIGIEKILLTHGHIDHAGGAAELKDQLKVKIEGPHRDDLFLMEALAGAGRQYGINDARDVVSDRWLEDGDTVSVGDVTFDVLHCPGHTPGHVVFANTTIKLAIAGDVLFQGSIGRTDFPRGNHDDLINSIKTKMFGLGDDVMFLCGHGPASTIGHERASNPFLQ